MDEIEKLLSVQVEVKNLVYAIRIYKDLRIEVTLMCMSKEIKIPRRLAGDELMGKVVDALHKMKNYERYALKKLEKENGS